MIFYFYFFLNKILGIYIIMLVLINITRMSASWHVLSSITKTAGPLGTKATATIIIIAMIIIIVNNNISSWRHYITSWSPWPSSSSTTASISSPLTDGVINTGDWHCAGGTSYPFLASSLSSPSSSPSSSLSFIIIIGDHDHNCPQPLKWSINHHNQYHISPSISNINP